MYFIIAIILLCLCGVYAIVYNCCLQNKKGYTFFDSIYESFYVVCPILGLIVFFGLMISIVYFQNIDTTLNRLNKEIYGMEENLSNPVIYSVVEDKITEYNKEIREKISNGTLVGWDTTKWKEMPVLDIDIYTLTIVEKERE